MPKRPLTVKVRIPPYRAPRQAWRRDLWHEVDAQCRVAGVRYSRNDRLEVHLRIYLTDRGLFFHDVDNRLKDCLDALQGRTGGRRHGSKLRALIPKDRQIWRVIVEKGPAPRQARGRGHLVIRKLKRRARGPRAT